MFAFLLEFSEIIIDGSEIIPAVSWTVPGRICPGCASTQKF